MSSSLHSCSCSNIRLDPCSGTKVDNLTSLYLSGRAHNYATKLLWNLSLASLIVIAWPSLHEHCPCSLFNGPLNYMSTTIKVLATHLDLLSSFSFCLYFVIFVVVVALAIIFYCIMFKYFSKVTTWDMLISINGS